MNKHDRRAIRNLANNAANWERAKERTWSVRYASGAVHTVKAADYGAAVERARYVSPGVIPVAIVLQD